MITRNAETPLNAALNYGYAILLSMVNREIVSRGYLIQCGICHRNEYNQFNLACDFMEPFRPSVDRLVVDSFAGNFDLDVKRVLADLANKSMIYKNLSFGFCCLPFCAGLPKRAEQENYRGRH